jgi:type II secretory pathway pseudopilin PulG
VRLSAPFFQRREKSLCPRVFASLSPDKSGFTLIEAMVAMSVLMIFFGAVAGILHTVLTMVGESKVRLVAASLAQERIEQVRNLSYEDVGVIGGIPAGTLPQEEIVNVNGQEFTINISVVYIDDPFDDLAPTDPISTDYKRARVAVSWGGAFPSKAPLVMVTDSAPRGQEMEDGGVLWVNVIDARGEAVQGATVTIQNSDVVPAVDLEIESDAKGWVVLPGADECTECYEISVSKNGYSSDRTYGTDEVTNPSKPHATVILGEVTELTFSIDEVSHLNVTTTRSRAAGYPRFTGAEFILKGSKMIGTDATDDPVYLFEETYVSGYLGQITINDLAWDTYEILFPVGSSGDIAGTNPLNPFSLPPGVTRDLWIVIEGNTTNSLLVAVKDVSDNLIPDVQVTLMGPLATASAGVTGADGMGDVGQVLFSSLNQLEYIILATKSGYLEASSSATIDGDMMEVMVLEEG